MGTMLFQFAGYPAFVRTIGIIRLLRGSGVFCALLFLALPDVQRLASSENASYVLGVITVVLVGSCTSVVRSYFRRCCTWWLNHNQARSGAPVCTSLSLDSEGGMFFVLKSCSGSGNVLIVDGSIHS